jgi:hypothetical protein
MIAIGFIVFWGCIIALLIMGIQQNMRIIKYNKMSKWDKLNKEFDGALDSMTPEEWDMWAARFKEKQLKKK